MSATSRWTAQTCPGGRNEGMRQPGRRQTARYPPPPRARAHTHPRRTLIPRQRSATLLHPTWALGGSSGARSVDRHWVRKEEDKRWCKNNCSCGSRVGWQGRLETVPAYQKHRGLPASCQYASSTQLARYHSSLSDLGLRVSWALCNVAAVGSQCPYACGCRLNCTHTRPAQFHGRAQMLHLFPRFARQIKLAAPQKASTEQALCLAGILCVVQCA